MTEFQDVVKQDTPVLFIRHRLIDGVDKFDWGITGQIPILSLVGIIPRVQIELVCRFHEPLPCPEQALVIAYFKESHPAHDNQFMWFKHPDIPIDPVVGMLEMIKTAVVTGVNAQKVVHQQRVLVGPDGRPIH